MPWAYRWHKMRSISSSDFAELSSVNFFFSFSLLCRRIKSDSFSMRTNWCNLILWAICVRMWFLLRILLSLMCNWRGFVFPLIIYRIEFEAFAPDWSNSVWKFSCKQDKNTHISDGHDGIFFNRLQNVSMSCVPWHIYFAFFWINFGSFFF